MEQKILNLWRDPDFSGAFKGIKAVKEALRRKGISISEHTLGKILKQDEIYVRSYIRPRSIRRRSTRVLGKGLNVELDVAHMTEDSRGYRYILTGIDTFTRFKYAVPLRTRKQAEMRDAIESMFEKEPHWPRCVRTDQEFDTLTSFFRQRGTLLLLKRGLHKSSFAERTNAQLKSLLGRYMASHPGRPWSLAVRRMVRGINNLPSKAHGLIPARLTVKDDVRVRRRLYGKSRFKFRPFFEEQLALLKKANTPDKSKRRLASAKDFRIGDAVYADRAKPAIGTSRLLKPRRTTIYRIARINFMDPDIPLYTLTTLKGKSVPSSYYSDELYRAPSPTTEPERAFVIEKILGEKTVRGRKYVLAHFAGFNDTYEKWIPDPRTPTKRKPK